MGGGGGAFSCEEGGGGGDGGAAQEASARAASAGSRKPAGRMGRGREYGVFIGAILYEPATPPATVATCGEGEAARAAGSLGSCQPLRTLATMPDRRGHRRFPIKARAGPRLRPPPRPQRRGGDARRRSSIPGASPDRGTETTPGEAAHAGGRNAGSR